MLNTFHLGVYGILKDGDRLLVVDKMRGPYMGSVDLPGGRPNHGEDLDVALKREVFEETGIIVQAHSLFANYSSLVEYQYQIDQKISFFHVGLVYVIEQADHSKFNPDINFEDTGGARWERIENFKNIKTSPILKKVLNEIS